MRKDLARRAIPGVLEFCRPEQGMEIKDVLADEVIELGCRIRPPVLVEVETLPVAEIAERAHVADRRVKPDVEVLAGRVGDFEAEVRRVARDVPVGQMILALGSQPLLEFVGRFVLQAAFCLRPAAEKGLAARVGEPEEIVLGLPQFGSGAGNRRIRILQVVAV
jgi:hypothetical protein